MTTIPIQELEEGKTYIGLHSKPYIVKRISSVRREDTALYTVVFDHSDVDDTGCSSRTWVEGTMLEIK